MPQHLAQNNLAVLAGAPGAHAFIVGISDYKFLPGKNDPPNPATFKLRRLSSPATSAYMFYEWLSHANTKLARSLGTCHLLLAPSPDELAVHPGMAAYAGATTADFVREIRQWRRLCSDQPESQVIFYFCGHGVQAHDRDAVLLLEDFGDPNSALESGCIRFSNIFEGMAPHQVPGLDDCTNIGREQFYFVDACREDPDLLKGLRSFQGISAFSSVLPSPDNRNAPIFFSTTPGDRSYGQAGDVSIFTGALLDALHKACDSEDIDDVGAPTWPVRTQFLHKVVKYVLTRSGVTAQRIGNLQGLVGDATLHYLPQAPTIDAEVDVMPAAIVGEATIDVDAILDGSCVWTTSALPRPAYPYKFNMPLGYYRIRAKHKDCSNFIAVRQIAADEDGSRLIVRMRKLSGIV